MSGEDTLRCWAYLTGPPCCGTETPCPQGDPREPWRHQAGHLDVLACNHAHGGDAIYLADVTVEAVDSPSRPDGGLLSSGAAVYTPMAVR